MLETYEAGIELKGTEVKSLRTRGCSIEEAFGRIENEKYLSITLIYGIRKSFYFRAGPKEYASFCCIKRNKSSYRAYYPEGLTIVPTRIYFNDKNFVKIEIALAKGKLLYDKRRKIKEELVDRETRREMKRFNQRNRRTN